MSFFSSIISIILSFFQALIGVSEVAMIVEMSIVGADISMVIYSWGASFQGLGILIPTLMVVSLGVTLVGMMIIFVFFDGARDLVGGS